MIIINSLIAISLIIISVVKTTEIFIESDHQLIKIQQQFVKKTRNIQETNKKNGNNQRGSISLAAALLTTVVSGLLVFYCTKMRIELREAHYRQKSYLCFHYLNVKTENYINEMSKFNFALRAAFIAQRSPSAATAATATAIYKALILARNIRHLNYIKNVSINSFCQLPETQNYLLNMPFKIKNSLELETRVDQSSILNSQNITYNFFRNPGGIRWNKSFCLRASLTIENAFKPDLKIVTEEMPMVDSLSLKCFSGSLSLP